MVEVYTGHVKFHQSNASVKACMLAHTASRGIPVMRSRFTATRLVRHLEYFQQRFGWLWVHPWSSLSPRESAHNLSLLGDEYTSRLGRSRSGSVTGPPDLPPEPRRIQVPIGVDTENGFKPYYVVPKEKKAQVKHLRDCLRDASALYLATMKTERKKHQLAFVGVLKPDVPAPLGVS